MARHRNVRGYNYDEDFEEDDLYGQSVEDEFCISPSTAAQFIYSRRDNPSGFAETLDQGYGYEDTEQSNYIISGHQLTGNEKAKLDSCLDRVKEVLGESVPEKVMIETVLNTNFDVQQALDSLLLQNNKQNMKTKKEETVIGGKSTKGLFCSETFSDVNNLINSLENTSDSASSCFGLGGPTVKFESPFNPSASSDTILFRPKFASMPSIKERTLNSSCKSLGALSLPFSEGGDEKSFYKPVSREVTLPLKGNTNTTRSCSDCDACFSLATELLKGSPSERKVQDLKVLLRLSETGDSSDAQDSASVVLQKNSENDSKGGLDNSSDIVNAFGNLMVDNKMNQNLSIKTELCGNVPSFYQNKGHVPKNHSCSSVVNISTLAESPSLADLLQEHQENKQDLPRNKACSLSDLCNQSSADFADTELGLPPLPQLPSQPHPPSGMTELSGSLSSLTFPWFSPVKELENLSLSDLIAKSIELDKTTSTCSHSEFHPVKTLPPADLNSDIDLSVLIRKSALSPEPVESQTKNRFPEIEYLFSNQRQQLSVAKGSKKSKKRLRSHFLEGTSSWTKGLFARPSAFAVTLCLHYPPKRCKRQAVNLHTAFSYNRQMREVKINEIGPLLAIAPFDFKSPSPDDIVKSGQKKAFAR